MYFSPTLVDFRWIEFLAKPRVDFGLKHEIDEWVMFPNLLPFTLILFELDLWRNQ